MGKAGGDTRNGGGGDDRILGPAIEKRGNDVKTGDLGADGFAFYPIDGRVLILDFRAAEGDTLHLMGLTA